MKKLSLMILILLNFHSVFSLSVSISDEATGTGLGSRSDVDLQDDAWRAGFPASTNFEVSSLSSVGQYTTLNFSGVNVIVSGRNWDTPTIGTVTSGSPVLGSTTSTTMQDSSPKPQSLYLSGEGYWNQTNGSTTSRNAILFEFDTIIDGFGVRLGDVETRTFSGGTVAEYFLYDSNEALLGSGVIPTSTPDQTLCGAPVDDDFRGCGSRATKWIGYNNDTLLDIKYFLIVVGDDDTTSGSDNGNTEYLSFIGATAAIVEEEIPDLGLVKTGSTSVMSGDMLGYTLVVTNHGPGNATGVVIEENYPTGFMFDSAFPSPTLGDNIWEVGTMASGAMYTVNITGTILGMTGDYLNEARVSAETETGSVVNTGSHITSIICHVDYGTTCDSGENACGAVGTGTIQCDGSCNAVVPSNPVDYGTTCDSGENACGAVGTGTIQCDGTCDAVVPSNDMCIVPTTDLTISIECTPEIMLTGTEVVCTVEYQNLGEVDAEDTSILVDIPENIEVTDLPVIPGVTCDFGSIACGGAGYTLAAGEIVSFEFDGIVTGNDGEVFDLPVSIQTTTLETEYENNTDVDRVQIYASSSRAGGNGSSNYCGDGIVRNGEMCDDGNNIDDDGCSSNCQIEYHVSSYETPVDPVYIPTEEEMVIVEMIEELKVIEREDPLVFNAPGVQSLALEPVALPDFLPKTGALLFSL